MNPYKFLFVTCVNDEALYANCVRHIQRLRVPNHYSIELFPIRGAKSMAEGYNTALTNNAKYKIYLHQDTFIINKDFLISILQLFQSNPVLGLLGTIGCKEVPASGNWWESNNLIGKIFLYHEKVYSPMILREAGAPFEPVEMVDGYLMVTQYDIPWRDDLFSGFHFYDTSQAIEFRKRGYLVGIPKQTIPWCLHYMNHSIDEQEYAKYQEIFLDHYKSK